MSQSLRPAPEGGPRFTFDGQRVRFQDVDHAGIVFFARIYDYCHVAYEEFIEQVVGYSPQDFFEASRLGAPLVATRSEHTHPLFHGDRLVIDCRVTHLGRSSMAMGYEVRNQDGVLCARVETRHVFVSRAEGFQSMPIPDDIRARFAAYHTPEQASTDGR